ncbi:helix-turn-helix domain-containing protein [Alkalibacillus sp. S2W]|uniref:helix-turn-helix domain-containing protein n=1 Tax=Alkalibacillus sp. S2W TaxID=3386553 RepID=UPI00398D5D36
METTKLFANETTYQQLSTFDTIETLNETVSEHKENLTGNARELLDVISRYAAKYLGVCYLRKNQLASMLGVTRRTIIRLCKHLEEADMIEQYELHRPTGDRRQSANAIVIKPVKETDENTVSHRVVTPECHTEETPANTPSNTHNNHVLETAPPPASALARAIPAPIFKAFRPFFNADELYEIYGVLLRAKAQINREILLEDHGERYAEVFQNVIRKYKRGEVRSLTGILYASWRDLTVEIDRELAVNGDKVSGVYFDWLAD